MRTIQTGLLAGLVALVVSMVPALSVSAESVELYDIRNRRWRSAEATVDDLRMNRVVLIGEVHDRPEHHAAQLGVIRALHDAGVSLGVGMEMFRRDSQPELDRWVAGALDASDFVRVYYDNWNYPWPLYGDILDFAREARVPVVGLNVARDITNQVARSGFGSLTEDQRGRLPDVTCRVEPEYMGFVRHAYGMHGHGGLNFTHFCEAQLVWDKSMAIHALDFLYAHPDRLIVILAGNGHVWRLGIPDQIRRRAAAMPRAIVLPFVPGAITPETATAADADYLVRVAE